MALYFLCVGQPLPPPPQQRLTARVLSEINRQSSSSGPAPAVSVAPAWLPPTAPAPHLCSSERVRQSVSLSGAASQYCPPSATLIPAGPALIVMPIRSSGSFTQPLHNRSRMGDGARMAFGHHASMGFIAAAAAAAAGGSNIPLRTPVCASPRGGSVGEAVRAGWEPLCSPTSAGEGIGGRSLRASECGNSLVRSDTAGSDVLAAAVLEVS